MFSRIKEFAPVPLAAPETKDLRGARFRVVAASVLFAAVCLFFGPFREIAGRFALPTASALLAFLAVQVPLWVRAKNRADDHFLMNGCGRDE